MPRTTRPLRYRQIHLDFHTSEHIPGVGAAFDAEQFTSTFAAAHVDSVTIFAKCHHGWSYYPTTVGRPHPQLRRPDLLGDMVAALAGADIESPIYISVQWDELTAREHPEWRAVSATNRYHHALPGDPSAGKNLSPAWHTICLDHAGYRNYILAQAREVASRYSTQGLFFDIVLTPDCVCAACLARMEAGGLDPLNPADRRSNDEAVNEGFRQEVSAALFAEFPGLRVFYNCGHIHKQGRQRFSTYTHLELESLPTGGWGYDHFPPSARYAATLGFDFPAHTGMPQTPFVMYDEAETIEADGAAVLAQIRPSYFNRTFRHYSSHQQTPDDPDAAALGPAVTEHRGLAYVAYPIFRLYRATGQPLYKYVVRGLLRRLRPQPALSTSLPSSGRATLTRQDRERRHVLHLLYGAPQVRGKDVRLDDGTSRLMEMIEDLPAIGPVTARVRLPRAPSRVVDALTGAQLNWTDVGDGQIEVTVPRLRIHTALVFENSK